jgi:hypothetical protein
VLAIERGVEALLGADEPVLRMKGMRLPAVISPSRNS